MYYILCLHGCQSGTCSGPYWQRASQHVWWICNVAKPCERQDRAPAYLPSTRGQQGQEEALWSEFSWDLSYRHGGWPTVSEHCELVYPFGLHPTSSRWSTQRDASSAWNSPMQRSRNIDASSFRTKDWLWSGGGNSSGLWFSANCSTEQNRGHFGTNVADITYTALLCGSMVDFYHIKVRLRAAMTRSLCWLDYLTQPPFFASVAFAL